MNGNAIREAGSSVPRDGAVRVTFLGVSTLLLDDGETQLMTDGFFTRPSLPRVVSSKIATDEGLVTHVLARVGADRVRGLFVAHSHHDHAMDCAFVAKRTGARLYGSASTLNVGRGQGVPEGQMERYRPGEEIQVGAFHVTVLESRHSPMIWPLERLIGGEGERIDQPLPAPARVWEYKEGGSYDLLVRHGTNKILIKPSANFGPRPDGTQRGDPLKSVRADVVFLGVGSLGKERRRFQEDYYAYTVGKLQPKLVIPIHWDNFFKPLSEKLPLTPWPLDKVEAAFAFLRERAQQDRFTLQILDGYESVLLFGPGAS